MIPSPRWKTILKNFSSAAMNGKGQRVNLEYASLSSIGEARFIFKGGDRTLIECTPLSGVGELGRLIDQYADSIHTITSDARGRHVLTLVRQLSLELEIGNIEYINSVIRVCERTVVDEAILDGSSPSEENGIGSEEEQGEEDSEEKCPSPILWENSQQRHSEEDPSFSTDISSSNPSSCSSSSSPSSMLSESSPLISTDTAMDYILMYHHALFHGALVGSVKSLLYLESKYPLCFRYITTFLNRNGRRERKTIDINDIDEKDLSTVGCSLFCMNRKSGILSTHMIPMTLLRVYHPKVIIRSSNLLVSILDTMSPKEIPEPLLDTLIMKRYSDQVLSAIFRLSTPNRQILWLDELGCVCLKCMNACTATGRYIDVFEFVRSRMNRPINLFYLLRVAAARSNVPYVLHILDNIFINLSSLRTDYYFDVIFALSCFKGDYLSGMENDIVSSKSRGRANQKDYENMREGVGIVALYNIPEYMSPIEGIILKLKKYLIDSGWIEHPLPIDEALPESVGKLHLSNIHIASILFREFKFSQEYRVDWFRNLLAMETRSAKDACIFSRVIGIIGEYSVSLLGGFMFLRDVPGGKKLLREIVLGSLEYRREEMKNNLPKRISIFVDEKEIQSTLMGGKRGKMLRCACEGAWGDLYDETIEKVLQYAIDRRIPLLTRLIHARYPIVDWY